MVTGKVELCTNKAVISNTACTPTHHHPRVNMAVVLNSHALSTAGLNTPQVLSTHLKSCPYWQPHCLLHKPSVAGCSSTGNTQSCLCNWLLLSPCVLLLDEPASSLLRLLLLLLLPAVAMTCTGRPAASFLRITTGTAHNNTRVPSTARMRVHAEASTEASKYPQLTQLWAMRPTMQAHKIQISTDTIKKHVQQLANVKTGVMHSCCMHAHRHMQHPDAHHSCSDEPQQGLLVCNKCRGRQGPMLSTTCRMRLVH
jgi:hypothetical protein